VSSQKVAPWKTSVLCYENYLLNAAHRNIAQKNISASKSVSTGLECLN